MYVVFIQMRGHDDLEALAPHFFCCLQTDLMGKVWGDFIRWEALIAMPGNIFILFPVLLLCEDHLL